MTDQEVLDKKTFMAQYIFQDVFMASENATETTDLNGYLFGGIGTRESVLTNGFLFLKDFNDVTGSELIEACSFIGLVKAKLMFESPDEQFIVLEDDSYSITVKFSGAITIRKNGDYFEDFTLAMYDFFRSKGYAFKWRRYHIKEQIELGWIKLKPSLRKDFNSKKYLQEF